MSFDEAYRFFKEVLNTTNDKMIKEMAQDAKYRQYKSGEFFVRKDNPVTMVPFLASGVVCSKFVDDKGGYILDTMLDIVGLPVFSQNNVIGASDELASIDQLFVSDGALWEVPIENIAMLIQKYPVESLLVVNSALARANQLHVVQKRILYLTPEERVAWIINEHPTWMGQVNQTYLSRFIGITPVSFSRIKKKLGGG